MMGRHSWGQENLFYVFDLDKHVPADHLLRAINQVLDLSDLRTHLEPYYSKIGLPRPSDCVSGASIWRTGLCEIFDPSVLAATAAPLPLLRHPPS